MSRLSNAFLEENHSNLIIGRMLFVFTVGAFTGRIIAGTWNQHPKYPIRSSILISGVGILAYFSKDPMFWLAGQALQGFSLGLYGVSMFRFTATLIPPGQRMRGFALIGMADFLGFAFGPALSGVLFSVMGFNFSFLTFFLVIALALIASSFLPTWEPLSNEQQREVPKLALKGYFQFIPLHVALLICVLYHIFYSRYLPILYHTGTFAIESWFFTGYLLGGIGIRLGIIRRLETMADKKVFSIALALMGTTALLVTSFPFLGSNIGPGAIVTGAFYGLGFEALYIFCLSYIAANSSEKRRGKVIAFVFMGFDLSNLLAGLSFGPLANKLQANGLFILLLVFLPILILLPFWLKNTEENKAGNGLQFINQP